MCVCLCVCYVQEYEVARNGGGISAANVESTRFTVRVLLGRMRIRPVLARRATPFPLHFLSRDLSLVVLAKAQSSRYGALAAGRITDVSPRRESDEAIDIDRGVCGNSTADSQAYIYI